MDRPRRVHRAPAARPPGYRAVKPRLCVVKGCQRRAYRKAEALYSRCDAHIDLLVEAIFGRRLTKVAA